MKKKILTPLAAALGTAFAITVAATPVAAAENPFGMSDLANGHQIAWGDKPAEGKKEGKCGAEHAKQNEGKCGSDKKKEAKKKNGKCGEGKCGEGKKADAKTREGKCGAKKKEGKCGDDKCGGT